MHDRKSVKGLDHLGRRDSEQYPKHIHHLPLGIRYLRGLAFTRLPPITGVIYYKCNQCPTRSCFPQFHEQVLQFRQDQLGHRQLYGLG